MKLLRWLLIFALASPSLAQNVRWDLPVYTTQAQGGNLLPVYAIPGALVSFYNEPAGTLANTYNSATSVSACPTGAQVVLNGSAACVSSADPYGNMGAWFLPGQYMATITAQGRSYNYYFTIPGGSASGVSSLNSLTGALTIACGSGLTCTSLGSTITITPNTGFLINSFTGCSGSLELGQTVTNPVCSATYTGTPTGANITNTDAIDSPLVLSSPYTSGTIVGSFHHTSVTTTTIQLTAIGSSTQTANQTYTWNPRIFGGVGASGATSTVTASGTTAVLSTTDVLPSAGLGVETVGETFGPYAPTGQAIYLLLTGGSHTFIDVCSGFPFAFNSPLTVTFVNQYGVSQTMYLYQSTNTLTGPCFEPKVVSQLVDFHPEIVA
jgi:hypothetical protein